MSTYPKTHTVIFIGRRETSDQKIGFSYHCVDERGEPTAPTFLFKKRVGNARGIGVMLELVEQEEGKFLVGAAKYKGNFADGNAEHRRLVESWQTQDETVDNAREMRRKLNGEDRWSEALCGIRTVYQSSNRRERAAIIGKVIMYLDSP